MVLKKGEGEVGGGGGQSIRSADKSGGNDEGASFLINLLSDLRRRGHQPLQHSSEREEKGIGLFSRKFGMVRRR